jgi:heme-degrading monooxygenase HmoA
MIRHIVMWKVAGESDTERLAAGRLVKAQFESLAGKVPGLLHIEVGIDESRIDYAADVVLVSEFESWSALRAYADHPAHAAVKEALNGVRITRQQVDYPVPERK